MISHVEARMPPFDAPWPEWRASEALPRPVLLPGWDLPNPY
jgi:hypothetical protein